MKKIDAHSRYKVEIFSSEVWLFLYRYVTYCCFSPDGKKIASTSNDKLLKIWALFEQEGKMIC